MHCVLHLNYQGMCLSIGVINMAATPVTIYVTMLILITSNITDELVLPNSQTYRNAHQILNDFHQDDMKLMRVMDDVREYNTGIDMDEYNNIEEDNVNLKLNTILTSNEEIFESTIRIKANIDSSNMKVDRLKKGEHKMYIDLNIDEENGDNIQQNAISKSNKETFEMTAKNNPIVASSTRNFNNILPENGVKRIKEIFNDNKDMIKVGNTKINSKTKSFNFNTSERVKRDSEDDDIIIWDYCEAKTHLEYIDGKFECVEVSFENRSTMGSLANCPNDTRRVILNRRVVFCRPKKRRH